MNTYYETEDTRNLLIKNAFAVFQKSVTLSNIHISLSHRNDYVIKASRNGFKYPIDITFHMLSSTKCFLPKEFSNKKVGDNILINLPFKVCSSDASYEYINVVYETLNSKISDFFKGSIEDGSIYRISNFYKESDGSIIIELDLKCVMCKNKKTGSLFVGYYDMLTSVKTISWDQSKNIYVESQINYDKLNLLFSMSNQNYAECTVSLDSFRIFNNDSLSNINLKWFIKSIKILTSMKPEDEIQTDV